MLAVLLAGAVVVGAGELTGVIDLSPQARGSLTATVDGDASLESPPGGSSDEGGPSARAETVLRFTVPSPPKGYVVSNARVILRLDAAARARLRAAQGGGAAGRTVRFEARTSSGSYAGQVTFDAGQRDVTLDVTDAVPAGGDVQLSVVVPVAVEPVRGAKHRPQLTLRYQRSKNGSRAARPQSKPAAPKAAGTATGVRIGMSAPRGQWEARLAQTGPVQARRIFGQLGSPSSTVKLARSEVAAGRMPILSFKVPGNDWKGVASGKYDRQLRDLTSQLAALGGPVFVTLHHEPSGDGTPASYAAMMRHALPILGAPASVDAGPIVNGYWWSKGPQGLTDAEIAQWLPADVLKVSETVAADTYQGGTAANPGEDAGVKIRGLSAWATRVGVTSLGIGEYNGLNAAAVKAAGDAILADPRFSFATIFNSDVNNRAAVSWTLTGARLQAFRDTLARAAG
ncbi:MAG TPA: hypothetical protein VFL94_07910 [Actinomycetales bacterium]|nr:hypothetical protein [Actinomycetales bacterium]